MIKIYYIIAAKSWDNMAIANYKLISKDIAIST